MSAITVSKCPHCAEIWIQVGTDHYDMKSLENEPKKLTHR